MTPRRRSSASWCCAWQVCSGGCDGPPGSRRRCLSLQRRKSWQGPLRPTLTEEQPDAEKPILPTPHGQTTPAGKATGLHSNKGVADCFLRLAALPTFPLDRLNRYERTLWRQARHIMITLESLRRRKPQPRRSSFPFSFRRPEPDRAISDEFE